MYEPGKVISVQLVHGFDAVVSGPTPVVNPPGAPDTTAKTTAQWLRRPSLVAGVALADLDPLRIHVEGTLPVETPHGRSQWYSMTFVDALADRKLDRERTGGVDAQSAELRVFHSTIRVARRQVCRRRLDPGRRSGSITWNDDRVTWDGGPA